MKIAIKYLSNKMSSMEAVNVYNIMLSICVFDDGDELICFKSFLATYAAASWLAS